MRERLFPRLHASALALLMLSCGRGFDVAPRSSPEVIVESPRFKDDAEFLDAITRRFHQSEWFPLLLGAERWFEHVVFLDVDRESADGLMRDACEQVLEAFGLVEVVIGDGDRSERWVCGGGVSRAGSGVEIFEEPSDELTGEGVNRYR